LKRKIIFFFKINQLFSKHICDEKIIKLDENDAVETCSYNIITSSNDSYDELFKVLKNCENNFK